MFEDKDKTYMISYMTCICVNLEMHIAFFSPSVDRLHRAHRAV